MGGPEVTTEHALVRAILDDPLNDGIKCPMKYSARAQALIDQWTARIGGLLTLRILADVLTEDGDERMASACRDAVRWFETSGGYMSEMSVLLEIHKFFRPDRGLSRLEAMQWRLFYPKDHWNAIELYADYPPLAAGGASMSTSDSCLAHYPSV